MCGEAGVLEGLGNVGDFVGGIAVVFTLIYLAIQVRQNSSQLKEAAAAARASTYQGAISELNQINIEIMKSSELSRFQTMSVEEFDKLEPDEQQRCRTLHLSALRIHLHLFTQYRQGLIEQELWNTHLSGVRGILSRSGAKHTWNFFKERGFFPTEFIREVERVN